MPPESLLAALGESPSYRSLSQPHFDLILRTAEMLEAAGVPQTGELLAKTLRTWFSRDVLDDTLVPMLERYGIFRRNLDGSWSLAGLPELLRSFEELPVCVFDVEATGGRPPLHRIIEFGAIRIEPDGKHSSLDLLIDPARPLPSFIARMTGLTQAQLDGSPRFAAVLEQIEGLMNGAILVAHNAGGDMELLNYEFHRHRGAFLSNPVFCSMTATKVLRPKIGPAGLEAIAKELGIEFDQAHRAFDDARATAAVWHELRKDLVTMGVRTLLDLSFFQGQLGSPQFLESRLTVERLHELPASPGVFKFLGAGGRVLHAEVGLDVRKAIQGYFYPRYKLAPPVKRMLRDCVDFAVELHPTIEAARVAYEAARLHMAHRRHSKGRRRR